MSGDHKAGGVFLRLWPAIAAGVGVAILGLLANLAQIDALLISGPKAVVRVLALFAIFLGGFILVQQKLRRNKTTIACWVVIVVSIIIVALLWPRQPSAPAEANSSDQTPANPAQTVPNMPTSQPPVHTLEQWATDVNKICAQEATRVGAAFEQFRNAGGTIIELSKQYQINTYSDVAEHADELDPPMQQAFDAAATVDSSYTTAHRQMTGADLPNESNDKTAAKQWTDRYEQLGDAFHTVYETLANYTLNEDNNVQATFFTKFALIDGPAYLALTPEVLDEGRELGVASCL